jgi:two-component system, chemotaxis family, chemotaxis protein CheY
MQRPLPIDIILAANSLSADDPLAPMLVQWIAAPYIVLPDDTRHKSDANIQGVTLVAVRVLIVDDSPFARKVISHHLEDYGCTVVGEAENGKHAIALFREFHPELVTLDVMMPVVDGIDSLMAFRQMRRENPRVAILIVSAIPFDKTRDTFREEGALGYVLKPFNRYSFDQVRMRLIREFPELDLR